MTYETITYKRCTIRLEQDEDGPNPRDCDNVGTMLCKHRNYILGDRERGDKEPDADEIIAITEREDVIWLPLYLYDHSGITMRAGSPGDNWMSSKGRFVGDGAGWDTSTVGVIYCTHEKALEEWGKKGQKKMTAKVYEQAVKYLESEVETYALYLEGNVYGFIAEDPDGNEIDSCWGFIEGYKNQYNTEDWYCVQEAKSSIDHWRETRGKELRAERKATWEARNIRDQNREAALQLL